MPGPGPQAHQVLVYSGPGVSALALSHTLLTLNLFLVPHYTVQPVTSALLADEPWEPTCALLVFPGGRDLPFVEELSLKTKATRRIAEYVALGGRYLGICAGAYFGSAEVKFDVGGDKEVTGKRDLALFPGACAGPTFPGFDYGCESGAHAVSLKTRSGLLDLLYYNGGGSFVLPAKADPSVEVLAEFADAPTPERSVAVVQVTKGQGKALLSAVHFEYPLEDPPARDAIAKLRTRPSEAHIESAEKARNEWVAALLSGLDLRLPKDDSAEEDHILLHPTHPGPIFALSHPNLPDLGAKVLDSPKIQAKLTDHQNGYKTLRDGNDEFDITTVDTFPDVPEMLAERRRTKPVFPPAIQDLSLGDAPQPPQPPNLHALTKTLLLPGHKHYSPAWTPLFNFDTYWAELAAVRRRFGRKNGVLRADETSPGRGSLRPSVGDLMFYGETVTSTQTMLDRNSILLNNLPAPLTFLASFQMAGRGRGSNLWLSPAGCLQFSILLTVPTAMASKLVFIQYLAAISIAEAVDEDGRLGVRIKWPNDLYAEAEGVGGTEVGSGKKGRAKLGGILVNTNYMNGQWRVVVGCGVNILNPLPTSSLSQLHGLLSERMAKSGSSASVPPPPTMEGTLARIMHAFETKWETFLDERGFEPFMDEYHSRWLHSGQEVTLTTVEPHQRLRVVSITPDAGLLRCVPIADQSSHFERNYDQSEDRFSSGFSGGSRSDYVDLQPDGNSFDLMAGMIKRKA